MIKVSSTALTASPWKQRLSVHHLSSQSWRKSTWTHLTDNNAQTLNLIRRTAQIQFWLLTNIGGVRLLTNTDFLVLRRRPHDVPLHTEQKKSSTNGRVARCVASWKFHRGVDPGRRRRRKSLPLGGGGQINENLSLGVGVEKKMFNCSNDEQMLRRVWVHAGRSASVHLCRSTALCALLCSAGANLWGNPINRRHRDFYYFYRLGDSEKSRWWAVGGLLWGCHQSCGSARRSAEIKTLKYISHFIIIINLFNPRLLPFRNLRIQIFYINTLE